MKLKRKMVRKRIKSQALWFLALALGLGLGLGPETGWGNTAEKTKHQVGQSVDIRQKSQKKQEQWEARKNKLTAVYDRLILENEQLSAINSHLSATVKKNETLNQTLEKEKVESLRIQTEMMPFLRSVQAKLGLMVEQDPPFLSMERRNRLEKLAMVMDDSRVNIAEKYRKVMEALSIEAEYGNTIEVYQDKIKLGGSDVLGNIFRLGRISLFFLSLDKASAAGYNVAKNQWDPLDPKFLPSISDAVEMASKQRPIRLISLPLGQLGRGGQP